jgi:hypothetical protein
MYAEILGYASLIDGGAQNLTMNTQAVVENIGYALDYAKKRP